MFRALIWALVAATLTYYSGIGAEPAALHCAAHVISA